MLVEENAEASKSYLTSEGGARNAPALKSMKKAWGHLKKQHTRPNRKERRPKISQERGASHCVFRGNEKGEKEKSQ